MEYKCTSCGKTHEEWPALSYNSPSYYHDLSDHQKSTIGNLDADFCTINYPDGQIRFIRCTLTQKVNDHCEDLEYGLWVSLSEKSFNDYSENYNNNNHEVGYFGWLSNHIPGYDFEKSIPTNVFTRKGGYRPEIIPHEDFDHPFVKDYYSGITKIEAERRINEMLNKQ